MDINKFFPAFGLLASFTLLASSTFAQDRGNRDFNPASILSKIDANQNDVLEPSEMEGRSGRYLDRIGIDTGKSIPIKDVLKKIGAGNSDDDQDQRAAGNAAKATGSTTSLKVPGFSDIAIPVPTFGSAESAVDYESFDKSVHRRVEETLYRHDLNRDGMLDSDEIKGGDWNPSPTVSDTNQDGRLSKIELAFRYQAKEEYEKKFERRDRRNWRDRDDDDDDSKRDSRDSRSSSRSSDRGKFGSSSNNDYSKSDSSSSSSSNNSSSNVSNEVREKYKGFAEGAVKKYDADGDGKLNEKEIKSMRRPPSTNADTDNDGFVSSDELLIAILPKESKESKKSDSSASKSSSRSSRSGSSRSSSSRGTDFSGLDVNENNQVEMHEFSSEWDEKKLAEFYAKDKNGDGVITPAEWSGK